MPSPDISDRRRRIGNALWGLFAADALAMPAHWFYSLDNLRATFDGGLTSYAAAPHPHPESFMVGMEYHPDIDMARRLGRPHDILHEHARFYDTSYSRLEIETGEREAEHGNATPRLEDRYHYHHGLEAGENTLAVQLVRVLMRSVIECGRYDEEAFLGAFVTFLTTPGSRRDPYTEVYLRRWFESYCAGLPPHRCAEHQRAVWSIGSHGGMIRPLVLALTAPSTYQGLGFALEHQNLTHRSENVAAALGVAVPLLHDLLAGRPAADAFPDHAGRLRVPRVTGEEMFAAYREHKGPGNIPDREMWKLHTDLRDEPFDLMAWVDRYGEEEVVRERLATACYPEHGLPLLIYLAAKNHYVPETALLANANVGGDNVHRGAVLGLLVGAASADEFPAHLSEGLLESAPIAGEIEAFSEIAAAGARW